MIWTDEPEYNRTREEVNRHPSDATEADEPEVLTALYGPMDHDGYFRGGGEL